MLCYMLTFLFFLMLLIKGTVVNGTGSVTHVCISCAVVFFSGVHVCAHICLLLTWLVSSLSKRRSSASLPSLASSVTTSCKSCFSPPCSPLTWGEWKWVWSDWTWVWSDCWRGCVSSLPLSCSSDVCSCRISSQPHALVPSTKVCVLVFYIWVPPTHPGDHLCLPSFV